jgi:plastocyanin
VTFRALVASALTLIALRAAVAAETTFLVSDGKQPVANAVVALYPLDAPMPARAPAAPLEIEQRELQFQPFVTALRVGSSVTMPNREKNVEHHVYSVSEPKKFEFPLYKPGKAETVVFEQPGLVVLGCNIHDSMLAYVVVLDSAWFARTAADGRASFKDLPAGRWRAETWHPRLKDAANGGLAVAVKQEFTVPATGAAAASTITLKLEPDRRIRRGPSVGAGYK